MSITPTVGRKVWYYEAGPGNILDPRTPFDATIVYVWGPGMVNLRVTDHQGLTVPRYSVLLREPREGDEHGSSEFATWMPYQMGQAKKDGQQQPPIDNAHVAPGCEQFTSVPDLQPYQQRVVAERDALDVKRAALFDFTTSRAFATLGEAEQSRLRRQYRAMVEYTQALDERISAF